MAIVQTDNSQRARVLDFICAEASAAVDPDRFPGFSVFTSGSVTVAHADHETITLVTDGRWAASAVRATLRQAGYAVEADPDNETATVTIWLVGELINGARPDFRVASETDRYGRTTFLLECDGGAVEQQCGAGGHNELTVHARKPFPGAARVHCPRHGGACWQRSDWPLAERVRPLIRTVTTDTGRSLEMTPEARDRMQSLYLRHAHRA